MPTPVEIAPAPRGIGILRTSFSLLLLRTTRGRLRHQGRIKEGGSRLSVY